jgi:hypothetical protein
MASLFSGIASEQKHEMPTLLNFTNRLNTGVLVFEAETNLEGVKKLKRYSL